MAYILYQSRSHTHAATLGCRDVTRNKIFSLWPIFYNQKLNIFCMAYISICWTWCLWTVYTWHNLMFLTFKTAKIRRGATRPTWL